MVKMRYIPTICPYCGTGCGLNIVVVDEKVVGVEPWKRHPVNEGKLCPKGMFSYEFINREDRLTKPLIKEKNGEFREANWEEALSLIATKLGKIKDKNPNDIGFFACARSPNENVYITQKFVRKVIGTNNIDHCSRICHGPTLVALNNTFGSGSMTNDYKSIEKADVIFIIGSNNVEAHPLFSRRVIKAKKNGAKIIVADPRYTPTAKLADIYLEFRSGGDVPLLNAMMKIIIDEGLQNDEFIENKTRNYEKLKSIVLRYDLEKVKKIAEVDTKKLVEAAILYGKAQKAAIVYSLGITEHRHGTDNVTSLANLAMLTANIGREGTGVNPLRGQNNVQGAGDMGALPAYYPGYKKINDIDATRTLEEMWDCKLENLAPGLNAIEMIEAAASGDIKAMYIIGEDPVLSDPNTNHVIKAISNLDFLVVQDIFMSVTARYADVVLPAASWGEQEGTVTNSERRVQLVRKAVNPPGEAKVDWEILRELAIEMGADSSQFTYKNAEEIFNEARKIIPDYKGISKERLKRPEGLHWPCPDENHPGTPILYLDSFSHPDGKGVFNPVEHIGPSELPDEDYPLILTTTRTLFHYHGTMTRKCKTLDKELATGYVEIHTNDAKKLGILNREIVKVKSRRGEIEIPTRVTDEIKEGEINIPMHFAECAANMLTISAETDPKSNMPEIKVCAAAVEKID